MHLKQKSRFVELWKYIFLKRLLRLKLRREPNDRHLQIVKMLYQIYLLKHQKKLDCQNKSDGITRV